LQLSWGEEQQHSVGAKRRYSDQYQCTKFASCDYLQVTKLVGFFLIGYFMYKQDVATLQKPWRLRKFFIDKQHKERLRQQTLPAIAQIPKRPLTQITPMFF